MRFETMYFCDCEGFPTIFHMETLELQCGKPAFISSNEKATSWIRGIPPEEGCDAREEPIILEEQRVPGANAFRHGLPAHKMPLWGLEKKHPFQKEFTLLNGKPSG